MRRRRRQWDDSGASAVEFALVAFVLVLLLFGIIQFGHLFFQWLETTHAAREGVRWAALGHDETEVRAHAQAAAPGLDWSVPGASVTAPNAGGDTGTPVTVTVVYPTPLFAPLMQNIFGVGNATTFTLRSAATQRIE